MIFERSRFFFLAIVRSHQRWNWNTPISINSPREILYYCDHFVSNVALAKWCYIHSSRVWKYKHIHGRKLYKSIWFDWFRQIRYIYKTKYSYIRRQMSYLRIRPHIITCQWAKMWNSCLYAFTNGFFSTVDSIPRKIDHERQLYAMRIDSRASLFLDLFFSLFVDFFLFLFFFLLFLISI